METNAFSSLAVLNLQSSYSLFESACCPDKDLVVLVSRHGRKDRLSLWKIQGPKIWEVQVGANIQEIVNVAWSPDGQTIAVAHSPPGLTLHSMQDGHEERVLLLDQIHSSTLHAPRITGLWWTQDSRKQTGVPVADIFRRNNVITGSAHSILKILPLLDHLQEDDNQLNAADLFAFQGTQTRSQTKRELPDFMRQWPALQSDPVTASMSSHLPGSNSKSTALDAEASVVGESLLFVADNVGRLFSFLDGSYPTGYVTLQTEHSIKSLFQHSPRSVFTAHLASSAKTISPSCFYPTLITMPLLDNRLVRDVAKSSTSARTLLWYIWRLVKDMRAAWLGSESMSGARELGPRWVRALEMKQTADFGEKDSAAILDLTRLLLTGRSTEALADLLGSGEQMSERGIQKWETTVSETLIKLRDFSEKRVTPAFQRLHLVLEEVEGWSLLPQYAAFEFSRDDVDACRHLCARGIVVSSWLASVARRELRRFASFVAWLRFSVNNLNTTNEGNTGARYDVLEVNNYFMSGLQASPIDKWFVGPIPTFTPEDLGVPDQRQPLQEVLEKARQAAKQGKEEGWRKATSQKDLDHIDRNLDALAQELATRCQRIFAHAAGAVSRSASVTLKCVCLFRVPYDAATHQQPSRVEVSIREFYLPEGGEEGMPVDLLEVQFFDDEHVVIVYRLPNETGPVFVATGSYNDLGYESLQADAYVNIYAREKLVMATVEAWNKGQLRSVKQMITRRRRLNIQGGERVSVAVNGLAGRRVACVLNEEGVAMEGLDLEGDGEDIEGSGEDG
ncbi:hypothetical protein PC9H_003670 [Pleurotus ostreatus]|uniref:Anaphase-promoting complex subunit 4 n=1 Tax=Pleurotus ostreatus TaxID=5322 RepID=A0A8H7DVI3_PLEOS|nr:uncharacterized protein PC9H_003670 [Pleurotus ostreatus]KAF7436837.1 hypothetical protein PC9H_003670 [Pleurotus ostreatus]